MAKVRKYKFHVYTISDETGIAIVCLNLPGICSEGMTILETISEFEDAATGIIQTYLDDRDTNSIPWIMFYTIPNDVSRVFWIDLIIAH